MFFFVGHSALLLFLVEQRATSEARRNKNGTRDYDMYQWQFFRVVNFIKVSNLSILCDKFCIYIFTFWFILIAWWAVRWMQRRKILKALRTQAALNSAYQSGSIQNECLKIIPKMIIKKKINKIANSSYTFMLDKTTDIYQIWSRWRQ